ncbi:uncharacterized protein LOC123534048 [Mercenaria mercenaria]|uniref:uncharacterized protein LOC123534048 n=1 Tax=Mercenaria mercenaria TaxID=6596 RepID=UPI00234EF7E6|nr:uncharacterized protein LOC123534048 [Mercenaria mercenaria]
MEQLNEHQAEENLACQSQILEYQLKIKELQNTVEILENKCQTIRVYPDMQQAADIRSQTSELKHAKKEIEDLKRCIDQMAVKLKKKDETLRKKDEAIRRKDDIIRKKDDIIRRHDETTRGLRKDMNKQFDIMNKNFNTMLLYMTEDRASVQQQLTQIKENMPTQSFRGPQTFNNKTRPVSLLTSGQGVKDASSKTTVLPDKLQEARGKIFTQTKIRALKEASSERAPPTKKQWSSPSKRRESTM